MSFADGEMVGPYRIVAQLGQGGMATVFKAYHAALDRYVAIKVLHPAFLEDSSFQTRFQREARLVAKLEHPNIVPIYDYAEHEGRPYLVMKFIEGKTLKAALAGAPLERDRILQIVQAVGAALSYAHQGGILHRDVKPSNVLLAEDGQIYLADFGLARIAQSGETSLTADMIVGTPQYISPEQAMGKKNLDEGTDIYSFGVMLYELTVGRVPFSADTPFSIIHDHIYTPLPLPRQVNPGVSEAVERVLLKTLSKERGDRYKNVRGMVDAFAHAWQEQAGEPGAEETAVLRAEAETLLEKTAGLQAEAQKRLAAAAAPPVPAGPPGEPAAEAPGQESAAAVPESAAKRPHRIPWMWLSVLVVLIIGCLVTLGALRAVRGWAANDALPAATRTTAALKTPDPDLAGAQQYATQNPDQPDAFLRLALAYARAGEDARVQQSLTALEGRGGHEEAFLWEAARQLARQQSWLGAARMAVDAAEMHAQTAAPLPDDLATLLHETVYKAMKNELARDYFSFERLTPIDEPLVRLAKARFVFFNQDRAEGQRLLDEVIQLKPRFTEAQLCQAEFSAQTGDSAKARQVLRDLRLNPSLPDWVIQEANIIEGTLP